LLQGSEPSGLEDVGQVLAALERIIAQKNQEGGLPRVEEARLHLNGLRETFQLDGHIQILGSRTAQDADEFQDFAGQNLHQTEPIANLERSSIIAHETSGGLPPFSEDEFRSNVLPSDLFSNAKLSANTLASTSKQNSGNPSICTIQGQDNPLSWNPHPTRIFPPNMEAGLEIIPVAPEEIQHPPDFGLNRNQEATDTLLETYLDFGDDDFADFWRSYQASENRNGPDSRDFEANDYHIDPDGNFDNNIIMSKLIMENQEAHPRLPLEIQSSGEKPQKAI
jgi:hypothetical protein